MHPSSLYSWNNYAFSHLCTFSTFHFLILCFYNPVRLVMWAPRRNTSAKKDSAWLTGPKFILRVSQPLLTHTAIQGKVRELSCQLPALCAPVNLSQLLWGSSNHGARPARTNGNCRAIYSFASMLANQNCSLTRPIRMQSSNQSE